VAVADTPSGVALSVADTGPGIPAEARAHVLERFVRLEESRNSPGTGLGLSLVAAVARLHDARLDLDDNKPGLKATLVFPNRMNRPVPQPRAAIPVPG
jgi:signal transduction histidine kinase